MTREDAKPLPLRRSFARACGVGCIALYIAFVVAGVRGRDFGFHWDESHHISVARRMVLEHDPIPHSYYYPSAIYWALVATVAPEALRGDLDSLPYEAFKQRAHGVFSALSALTILCAFVAARAGGRSPLEALWAAAIVAGSWELSYHARFVAPDGLMTAASSLCLVGILWARREPARMPPVVLAAIGAGIATSSKYPCGLLVVPCLIVAWGDTGGRARRLAAVLAAFACATVAVTPAFVVEPGAVIERLRWLSSFYSGADGLANYNTAGASEHAFRIVSYLLLVLASPWALASAAIAGLAMVGLLAIARTDRRLAVALLSFPVAYSLFFITHDAMLPRNSLVLLPFLALLAARGAAAAVDRASHIARAAIIVACAVLAFAQLAFVQWTASTIPARGSDGRIAEATAWLHDHPARRVLLSPRVAAEIGAAAPANATVDPSAAITDVMLYPDEGLPLPAWPGATPGLTERWFGPYEINWNMYPSWMSNKRILLLDAQRARALGVVLLP